MPMAPPSTRKRENLANPLPEPNVFSDNVPLTVAEADNGHGNADSQWYEPSRNGPIGKENIMSLNQDGIFVVRETGHTINVLCFDNIRNKGVECYN